jgi:hypothetical protein
MRAYSDFSKRKAQATRLIFAGLLLLGAILRLIDLTDPPLDFHPTRQLRGMLVSRDIYYQLLPDADPSLQAQAASFRKQLGLYEPPVFETLVAWSYIWAGGENIVIPRVYNTIFWLIGGIALYALARRLSSDEAGLVSLAFYLVLPFSVEASRSFQPDPLMTSLFIIGMYFLYRWVMEKKWKWSLLAALLFGFAALVKIVIAFYIAPLAIAAVLLVYGKKFWRSPQTWAMALLMVFPAFTYYILGTGENSSDFFINRTVEMVQLILSTKFYLHWMHFVGSLFGLPFVYLSFLGALLLPSRGRTLLLSLWLGYFLYGIALPFQIYTHSYYHIQLIPLVALGLAPVAKLLFAQALGQSRFWRGVFLGAILLGIAYPAWVARSVLVSTNYRNEALVWQNIGEAIPADRDTIALTQDYGYRLMVFGWRKVSLWPPATTMKDLRGNNIDAQEEFDRLTDGEDFFLVTAFGQLAKQPELKKILENYPVASQGDGFVIYDLR